MSYTPTTWQSGDVVTATKMNKIEQGIADSGGGGGFLVTFSDDGNTVTCDKTFSEIRSAIESGKTVSCLLEYSDNGDVIFCKNLPLFYLDIESTNNEFVEFQSMIRTVDSSYFLSTLIGIGSDGDIYSETIAYDLSSLMD